MRNDRLLELLGRKSAGELTLKEQIELGQLLKEHPGDQSFAAVLEALMTVPTSYPEAVSEKAVDDFISQVQQKIERKRKGARNFRMNRWGWRVAAAVLILVLAGIGYYRSRDAGNTVPNLVATKKREQNQYCASRWYQGLGERRQPAGLCPVVWPGYKGSRTGGGSLF